MYNQCKTVPQKGHKIMLYKLKHSLVYIKNKKTNFSQHDMPLETYPIHINSDLEQNITTHISSLWLGSFKLPTSLVKSW